MISVGSKVRVKYPFNQTFTEEYIVESTIGNTYYLSGIDGAFDIIYLEEII